MCLILLAWKIQDNYPLVLLANRDEYYDRPTSPAHFWHDEKQLLAKNTLSRQECSVSSMANSIMGRLSKAGLALTNIRACLLSARAKTVGLWPRQVTAHPAIKPR